VKTPSEIQAEILSDLNPPQIEAVKHVQGPILILAGAGSGKTRVLTRRIANLVLTHGVNPRRILAVTFTNKAADEMRERLRKLLDKNADYLWASTFHSACLRILRQHAQRLGYRNDFVIYDDQDSKNVLKEIIKDLGLNDKKFSPAMFTRLIDDAKNAFILPEQYREHFASRKDDLAPDIYTRYQQALLAANAMDFGDLLMNAVLLFQKHPEVLETYQNALQFVLVDEFQDTNQVQYLFLKMLSAKHKNLLVVGDDDQSIYAFRGASIKNILNFEKDYADTKVIKLEQNYRSSANIINIAHAVIEKNKGRKEKKLWTKAEAGSLATTFVAQDELEEGEFVALEIKKLLAAGRTPDQIAIFYRVNAQSRAIEEALMNYGIAYRIFGGLKFYERKEIKDLVAYLRLIQNDSDNQAFLRVINTPPRGIGPQSVKNITQSAKDAGATYFESAIKLSASNKSVAQFVKLIQKLRALSREVELAELITKVIELSEYGATLKVSKDHSAISRLENLQELEAIARVHDDASIAHLENLQTFLDRIALVSGADVSEQKGGEQEPQKMVTLSTLHLAKGLEFPVVFLTGFEDGLLPHHRSINDPFEIEEERRLCYVGITRAMQQLYLSRAYSRGMFASGIGTSSFRDASRFARDIPAALLEHRSADFVGQTFEEITFSDLVEFNSYDEEADSLGDEVAERPIPKKAEKIIKRRAAAVTTADKLVSKN